MTLCDVKFPSNIAKCWKMLILIQVKRQYLNFGIAVSFRMFKMNWLHQSWTPDFPVAFCAVCSCAAQWIKSCPVKSRVFHRNSRRRDICRQRKQNRSRSIESRPQTDTQTTSVSSSDGQIPNKLTATPEKSSNIKAQYTRTADAGATQLDSSSYIWGTLAPIINQFWSAISLFWQVIN